MSKIRKSEGRKESYKRNPDFVSQNRHNRFAGLLFIRQFRRDDHLFSKRTSIFDAQTPDNQQGIDLSPDMSQVSGFFTMNQTVGRILCCQCGTPIPPNKANMCNHCLRVECNVASTLPSRVNITYCPDCGRYLQPPTTWLKAERDSKELLSFCLKRLKLQSEFRLVHANFLPTEPHSKRIQLRLRVQSEVLNQVYAEKSHDVEFVVGYQKCHSCMPGNPDHWEGVVQVRQHVSHMRTFLSLEQLIIKHHAALHAVKIKPVKDGIDFFFRKKSDAAKFFFFLARVAPVKLRAFQKKLKSQDSKSNISRYEFAVCATISPICHDDLVYLPSKLSAQLGNLGPLVICTKVSNNLSFLNPFTLQSYVMTSGMYWKQPFESLLSCKQLVEYIVLDVEVVTSDVESRWLGHTLADVQIARVSDFGKNDKISSVRTHLGRILKPGDFALGYDLSAANFNNVEAEERRTSFPDVVLIKKTYREEQRQASVKDDSLQAKDDSEYERFKKDLLVNPELRFNISLDENEDGCSKVASSVASDLDHVPLDRLEDIFAELGLSDEDGSVNDKESS
ncbi:hypothetical protein RND81_10G008500 [Saponaria officinalis]|uniref:60S ribosomal export protein NMD3 n=1 Tax=Saponaria officinalis TaxID=3572 RepID=A0AAW1HXF5_SAPOF